MEFPNGLLVAGSLKFQAVVFMYLVFFLKKIVLLCDACSN
jgi:hypothetical protein